MRETRPDDPRGLIREAYRIDGITPEQCRSIFFDWALGLPPDIDQNAAVARLHSVHAPDAPDHPMTKVLSDGMTAAPAPRRRGGRAARR